MTNNYIAQVPINGYELEQGSQVGLELTFAWLSRQLKLGGKLRHNEMISQINIKEDGVVLFVKPEK